MNALFLTVYILWPASEIILIRRIRSGQTDQQQHKTAILGILLTLSIPIIAALYLARHVAIPISTTHALPVRCAGLALIVLGTALRLAAIKTLGRLFTPYVTICENHTLKTDGLYKHIRHPSYAALLLSFMGLGISLNNWFSLGVLAVLIFAALARRIQVEETVLAQQFGEAYAAYRQRTKRLLPFVY